MKGVINILEVMTVGIILLMALIFFFPHYSIKSRWNSVLLSIKVKDTLNTIDRMNKTLDFAKNQTKFDNFMKNIYTPPTGYSYGAIIWWKNIQSPFPNFLIEQGIINQPLPYFTEAEKETIIDVINTTYGYRVYSFTLGLGYPY